MKEFKLHPGNFFGGIITRDDCEYSNKGEHGPFLFVRDRSNEFESGIYYECICLQCGRYDVFSLKDLDIFEIINTHKDNLQSILEEVPHIRRELLDNDGLSLNEKVIKINNEYLTKKNELGKSLARTM